MPVTLAEIAAQLPEATLVGDGSIAVREFSHPRMISSPKDMILALEAPVLALIQQAPVKPHAAVVADGLDVPEGLFAGYIKVKRPRFALVTLLQIFDKPVHAYEGIHPTAVIEASAQVDATASVGAFTYVGENAVVGKNSILMPHVTIGAEARLGDECLMHPGVRIGERVLIGNRVVIHPNASIGADGFSYVTPEPGSIESAQASGGQVKAQNTQLFKINSIGTVILEDDVEVGACATIDRSNLGATLVKRGTKIDNLVMIGHNNTIGENCLIVSQVGIAGSCTVGNRVVMAGQAGLGDHLTVGDDAIVMAKSGVMRDIKPKEVVVGIPALPRREALQNYAYAGKLRDLFQEVKALKKRLEELEASQAEDKVGV